MAKAVTFLSDPVTVLKVERPAVAQYPPGATLAKRTIDDHELVWPLQGRAVFSSNSGDTALAADELLLVPPGLPHSFSWDPRRTSRHGYLHFSLGPADAHTQPLTRRMGEQDPITGLLRYLLWLGTEPPGWRPRAAHTVGLLVTLLAAGPLPAVRPSGHPGLERALDHVARRWRDMPLVQPTLCELAGAARISESVLARAFHAEYGRSPAAALEGSRLLRARDLLRETALSVESIGRACGFADGAHFAHRCRAVWQVSPRELRAGVPVEVEPALERLGHRLFSPQTRA